MTEPHFITRARQGDIEAITILLNQAVSHKRMTVKVNLIESCLEAFVESAERPDPYIASTLIFREILHWKPSFITVVKVHGYSLGELSPEWTQELDLTQPVRPQMPKPPASLRSAQVQDKNWQNSKRQTSVKKPIRIEFSFDPLKLVGIGLIALYGFLGSLNPSYNGPFLWLHYPDLAIHETGHLLFMLVFGAGSFLHILGGSLTQILFPAVFSIYFFLAGQRYSSAIALFWTAQNFMDVSVYIKDAQARELPLTVDNPDAHDWYNILGMIDMLQWDQQIGNFVYSIGVLVLIASILLGLYYAQLEPRQGRSRI